MVTGVRKEVNLEERRSDNRLEAGRFTPFAKITIYFARLQINKS